VRAYFRRAPKLLPGARRWRCSNGPVYTLRSKHVLICFWRNRRQKEIAKSIFLRALCRPTLSSKAPTFQLPWRRRRRRPWRIKHRPCSAAVSATRPSSTPLSDPRPTPTTGQLNRTALQRLTGNRSNSSVTAALGIVLCSKLKYLVASSVSEACNNSVLLLGPRGCRKGAVRFPFLSPHSVTCPNADGV
jgi:hypothetical protein